MTVDNTPAKPRRCPTCNAAVWQGSNGTLIENGGSLHRCPRMARPTSDGLPRDDERSA